MKAKNQMKQTAATTRTITTSKLLDMENYMSWKVSDFRFINFNMKITDTNGKPQPDFTRPTESFPQRYKHGSLVEFTHHL